MADKKPSKGTESKRVQPGIEAELSDESLESVAGGCQQGCSNLNSCVGPLSQQDGSPILEVQGN